VRVSEDTGQILQLWARPLPPSPKDKELELIRNGIHSPICAARYCTQIVEPKSRLALGMLERELLGE